MDSVVGTQSMWFSFRATYIDHRRSVPPSSAPSRSEGCASHSFPQPIGTAIGAIFKKFGRPRLFFAITAGAMDSLVNHYTANRRRRSNDAYSPDGRAGLRPDNCTIVYANILKELYPDVPLVIGGIEASLRRFSHYDYWTDSVHRSILVESKADLLVYGMGEKPMRAIAQRFKNGEGIADCHSIHKSVRTCEKAASSIK